MFFVYILYSKKFDRYYIGLSSNYQNRLAQHNKCEVKSTKAFVPWEIIHLEEYPKRIDARTREKYLKSSAGRRWRKKHIIWPRGATE